MTQIILVRHAMPQIDEMTPAKDWQLSDEGRVASAQLAETLRPYAPTRVFTSREPKAYETGAIIAERLALPVAPMDGLHEQERANEGYHPREVLHAKIRALFDFPATLQFGTETADAAYQRVWTALHQIAAAHPQDTVIVATHGTVITLVCSRHTGEAPFALWQSLKLPDYRIIEISPSPLE